MRDVDEGDAQLPVQRLQLDLHVLAQLLVERAQRLVHQHELGVEHQRPGQGHALLLPAGELRRVTVRHASHLHHVQRALDLGVAFRARQATHGQRIGDVVRHRHVGEERVVLEHHPEVPLVRRGVGDVAPAQPDFARRGGLEAGQHHQRGGFARARRPQQREELPSFDVEMEVAHHQVLAVVGLLDAGEGNQGGLCRHASLSSTTGANLPGNGPHGRYSWGRSSAWVCCCPVRYRETPMVRQGRLWRPCAGRWCMPPSPCPYGVHHLPACRAQRPLEPSAHAARSAFSTGGGRCAVGRWPSKSTGCPTIGGRPGAAGSTMPRACTCGWAITCPMS